MISLPYHQIIGATLTAIIDAEALAARATADFITSVGFLRDDKDKEASIGKLRTVLFTYRKQDVDGRDIEEEIELPLLSLVPIPMLQVRDASIKFGLKITDTEPSSRDTSKSPAIDPVAKRSLSLVGSVKPSSSNSVTANADMQVEINIKQSDIPTGLQRLFQVMENATMSRPVNTVVKKVK